MPETQDKVCIYTGYEPLYPVRKFCKAMQVHPSGYYVWIKDPISNRAKANEELAAQIKDAYAQSNNAFGYWNIH